MDYIIQLIEIFFGIYFWIFLIFFILDLISALIHADEITRVKKIQIQVGTYEHPYAKFSSLIAWTLWFISWNY